MVAERGRSRPEKWAQTIDMVAIPIKSVRLLSDGLSTGNVISVISKGDYPEAAIGATSIVAGAGAGHFLKTLTKKDPIIRGAGTGVQRSTSEILEKDCFSCNS